VVASEEDGLSGRPLRGGSAEPRHAACVVHMHLNMA
jgi:hypothetical protein